MGRSGSTQLFSLRSKAKREVARPMDPEMMTDRKEDAVVVAKRGNNQEDENEAVGKEGHLHVCKRG